MAKADQPSSSSAPLKADTVSVTVVRWKNPMPDIYDGHEVSAKDFERVGIYTQRKTLRFTRENNFHLRADQADINPEALEWLRDQKEFTVEEQEVSAE